MPLIKTKETQEVTRYQCDWNECYHEYSGGYSFAHSNDRSQEIYFEKECRICGYVLKKVLYLKKNYEAIEELLEVRNEN